MPLLEFLGIKGALAIGKFITAKGMASAVAHSLIVNIQAYGISQVLIVTASSSVFVGGAVWTADRVNNLRNGIRALEQEDWLGAVKNFGKLAISHDIDVEILPDYIHDFLVNHAKVEEYKASEVAEVVRGLEGRIASYVASR